MTAPIPLAFSPETIRELKFDQPEQQRRIAERMARDDAERAPLHLRFARLLRPLRRPSPATLISFGEICPGVAAAHRSYGDESDLLTKKPGGPPGFMHFTAGMRQAQPGKGSDT